MVSQWPAHRGGQGTGGGSGCGCWVGTFVGWGHAAASQPASRPELPKAHIGGGEDKDTDVGLVSLTRASSTAGLLGLVNSAGSPHPHVHINTCIRDVYTSSIHPYPTRQRRSS